MTGPFRHPRDVAKYELTEQVCGSPKQSAARWLKDTAKKEGSTLSHFVGGILNDYVEWAMAQGYGSPPAPVAKPKK